MIIGDELFRRARALTGIQDYEALVRAGLETLIARGASKRLAAHSGAEPKLRAVPPEAG